MLQTASLEGLKRGPGSKLSVYILSLLLILFSKCGATRGGRAFSYLHQVHMEELLNLLAPRSRGGSSDHRFSLGFAPPLRFWEVEASEPWTREVDSIGELLEILAQGKGVGELLRALPSG